MVADGIGELVNAQSRQVAAEWVEVFNEVPKQGGNMGRHVMGRRLEIPMGEWDRYNMI